MFSYVIDFQSFFPFLGKKRREIQRLKFLSKKIPWLSNRPFTQKFWSFNSYGITGRGGGVRNTIFGYFTPPGLPGGGGGGGGYYFPCHNIHVFSTSIRCDPLNRSLKHILAPLDCSTINSQGGVERNI